MLKILFGLLVLVLFSCGRHYPPDYEYKWKIAIVYTNGDKDTLNCGVTTYKGNEAHVFLRTTGTAFSGAAGPCLLMICGWYESPIACGIRKYDIINEEKIPVK